MARRAPTVALGHEIARRYRRGAPVINTGFSLVPSAELRPVEDALSKPWDDERVILTVSRLDAEKNPLLLLDVMRRLHDDDPRWRLVIAGDGPMRPDMEGRRAELGLTDV